LTSFFIGGINLRADHRPCGGRTATATTTATLPLSDADRNLVDGTLGLAEQLAEHPAGALGAHLEDALIEHTARAVPLLVSRGFTPARSMALLDALLAPVVLADLELASVVRDVLAEDRRTACAVLRRLPG
jgi:hypothetical protein